MKKIIKFSLCALLLIGCGGGGGNSNTDTSSPSANTQKTITGIAYDGLIYNAKVQILDENNNTIGKGYTSANPDNLGSFSVKIKNLPKSYIIKITGGVDTGSDDIKNGNDYNSSLTMISIGQTKYITPITTAVAYLVDKGYSLNEAKNIVKKSLGISEDINITQINPRNNLLAKKAIKTLVLTAMALPGNENENLKNLSDVMAKEKIANINSVTPLELNLSAIEVSTDEKKLIQQNADLIKKQINETLNAIDTNDTVKIEANIETIKLIRYSLENKSSYTSDDILLFKEKLANVLKTLQTEHIKYNLAQVKKLVEENLDKNSSIILNQIKKLQEVSSISEENKKILYKELFEYNSSIDINKLNNYDLSVLDIDVSNMEEKEFLYKIIARIISNNINNQNLENVFLQINKYIINNYDLRNYLDQLFSNDLLVDLQSKTLEIYLKNLKGDLILTYFARNSENLTWGNVFNEETINNLNIVINNISSFVKTVFDNDKKFEIFKTIAKYTDINDTNDFNQRIVPLFNMLNASLLKENISFIASLQNFENKFRNDLLNKTEITQNDIKPIMFPKLIGFKF
ncbi:MAG: hypothetical protein GXO49_06050 [Chlorobi bacterium]|nr:hypothetical protein [Chlorobiota bacterium]